MKDGLSSRPALGRFFSVTPRYVRGARPYFRLSADVASLSQSLATRSHASLSRGLIDLAACSWASLACLRNLSASSGIVQTKTDHSKNQKDHSTGRLLEGGEYAVLPQNKARRISDVSTAIHVQCLF
jgi:hypothetical protein